MYKWVFILVGSFLLSYFPAAAQQGIDGAYLFKMWLFLEKRNVDTASFKTPGMREKFKEKDRAFFEFFARNVHLQIDTVKSEGFPEDFTFLSLQMGKQKIVYSDSATRTLDDKAKSDLAWYLLIAGNCDRYVLGVNRYSGTSYRLSGFEGNDFMAFLDDVKRAYYYKYQKKLKNKQFFEECTAEGLDFRCIYNALTSGDAYDATKFPCLKKCSTMSGLYYTEPWH